MKTFFARYPIVAIVLLLLTCVQFKYQAATWEVFAPGLAGGLVVLAIIGIVLLHRTYKAVQGACLAHGIPLESVRSKYDILLPIAIVAVIFHLRYVGEPLVGVPGKTGYRWEFRWSDTEFAIPFLATLYGVILLLRVLAMVRAIGEAAGSETIK